MNNQSPAEIRHEIEETKASISTKLETLGSELRDTVDDAKSAVQETVHGVRENLSFEHHYRQHPWSFFAGAVGMGCLIGRALVGGRTEPQRSQRMSNVVDTTMRQKSMSIFESVTGGLTKTFDKEIQSAKKLAIGTALAIVRDIAKQAVPAAAAQRTAEVIDDFTRSLGGEPLRERPTARVTVPDRS